jgi:hypothetical protein
MALPLEHLVPVGDLKAHKRTARHLGLGCRVIRKEGEHYLPTDHDFYPYDVESGKVIIRIVLKDGLTPWDYFEHHGDLNFRQPSVIIALPAPTESRIATNA